MIKIVSPKPEDAEGMNEVIKLSWYATYIDPKIGVTKEDIDSMYAQSEKRQIEVFRHRAENPKDDDISLVAKEDKKVIGVIRVKIFSDYIRLRTIYVHPGHTGKGVGTSMWKEIQKLIPKDKPVIAYPVEHTKSVYWYKKMGFIPTGEKILSDEVMNSGARTTEIKMVLNKNPMDFKSKNILLGTLFISSLVLSRLMFFFFDDPEGPNLLIVTVFAIFLYFISYGFYKYIFDRSTRFKGKAFLFAILIQIVVSVGIYFCLDFQLF